MTSWQINMNNFIIYYALGPRWHFAIIPFILHACKSWIRSATWVCWKFVQEGSCLKWLRTMFWFTQFCTQDKLPRMISLGDAFMGVSNGSRKKEKFPVCRFQGKEILLLEIDLKWENWAWNNSTIKKPLDSLWVRRWFLFFKTS